MARFARFARLAALAALLAGALAPGPARAQDAGAAPPEPPPGEAEGLPAGSPLRVGVAGSEPFVVEQGDGPGGLSVDIWQALAARVGVGFELVPVADAATAIDRVASGELDAAIGPLSITAARAQRVDFTQPYFESDLAIAAPAEGASLFDRLAPFFSKAFAIGAGALLLVLAGVGTLLWLTERRANPEHFPASPVKGIGNGVWMALVTMTTVGYGDRVPITVPGRIVTGIWMTLAMLTASSLTAFIATALTVAQLDEGVVSSAGDLEGTRVAVVQGTTAVGFARGHGARTVAVRDVEAALEAVAEGDARAVVFDRPVLRYHLRQRPELDLVLSQAAYMPQGYGFALPRESELRHRLNVALLELTESRQLDAIQQEWLGG